MAVMMAKLYQALRAANVSDDAAREAAEEAAAHENRFTGQPPWSSWGWEGTPPP